MGNDVCLAWPWAELAVMGAGQAAAILQRRATHEERAAFEADYAERLLNPYVAAERGYVDAVIDPADTRREIAAALDMLDDKRELLSRASTATRRCEPRSSGRRCCRRASGRDGVDSHGWRCVAGPLDHRDRRSWRPLDRHRRTPCETHVPIHCEHEGSHVPDTITITDDRTGKTVTVPIEGGVFPSSALARARSRRCSCYDPAYHVDGSVQVGDHVPRRRQRRPALPRLSDRAARREVDVPRGGLPAAQRRTARPPTSSSQWTHDVTHHTFIHENMRKRFVDGFHYDAHPMGMFVSARRRARHVLRGRQGHRRPGCPPPSDPAPDRQDPDDRRDVLPLLGRPAVQPTRTTSCRTRRTSST